MLTLNTVIRHLPSIIYHQRLLNDVLYATEYLNKIQMLVFKIIQCHGGLIFKDRLNIKLREDRVAFAGKVRSYITFGI